MTKLVKFADLPSYPENSPTKRIVEKYKNKEDYRLIEPLVITPDGNIHPQDRNAFELFRAVVEASRAEGVKVTDSIIAVDWADLTEDDKLEYPLPKTGESK